MTRSTGRTLAFVVVYALVGLLVVLLLALLTRTWSLSAAIRDQQQSNKPVLSSTEEAAKSADQTLQLFLSCTTPGHPCYRQSQESTKKVQDAVNQVTIYAAYCASKESNKTPAQIKRCVDDLRKKDSQ